MEYFSGKQSKARQSAGMQESTYNSNAVVSHGIHAAEIRFGAVYMMFTLKIWLFVRVSLPRSWACNVVHRRHTLRVVPNNKTLCFKKTGTLFFAITLCIVDRY